MKRLIRPTLLLLTIMFLLFSVSYGQTYKPFLEGSKQWNIMITSYAYGGSVATMNTLQLHITANDTLINDTVYRKVVNTGYSDGAYPAGVNGYIREVIDEKKVYFRENFALFYPPKDRLLYDFSLETGDTTEIFGLHHCTWNSNTFKVISTGTVNLLNDEVRKTWYLEPIGDNAQEADLWIEGIGSMNGMLFPGCSQLATISFSLDLLCYYEDDLNLYMSYDSCFIDWTTGLEAHEEGGVKLYPNPATFETWLQLSENIVLEKVRIELYSSSGRQLYKAQPTSNFHKIETVNLPKGLYLVRVWNGERWMVEKLVVR
ncbi:MAG: T9SS type A sorting domain-containing protein [Bacteroidetes bacterium]|nr:T9SS type A sorting domain-containing protein [Bacteroidota bacterium]